MKKMLTSPNPVTKLLTVSYSKAKYNQKSRYIHKYYLSQELKSRISLADIKALMCDYNDWNLYQRDMPSRPPSYSIHYSDLNANKTIPGHQVQLVLHAIADYFSECKCELTEDENRAAINLNTWLTEWEKKLLSECVRITEEMEHRVRSNDLWLTDYEIDLKMTFYVRDDDPFSAENDPEADANDIDSEAQLLCTTGLLLNGLIFEKDVNSPEYCGIGDGRDYKENSFHKNSIFQAKHCSTFHDLYNLLGVPMKHMGRIGRVYTDIKVYCQNGLTIDLAGKQPFVNQDEPRIRGIHRGELL